MTHLFKKDVEESDEYEVIPVQSKRSLQKNKVSMAKSQDVVDFDQEASLDE
jgi:hypothetical protein